ncbi:MAG: GntR family transcriptional regulator [Pseudonocardiaceae bacterium]
MQAPRYREVAEDIREAILREQTLVNVQLADGAQLPTEPELGSHFQVSRGTIRQALRELAAEGLIETRGRSGTYVRRLPMPEYNTDAEDPHRRDDQPSLAGTWFSVVKRSGRQPREDFRFRIQPATIGVASRLHVEVNDLVVVRECIRHVDEIPWSEQVTYYPYPIAERCDLNTPHDVPEGTVRRMAIHGVTEERLDHEISGRPANDEERRRFELASGVSVLIYRRVGWSRGQPIRYTVEILPADRNVITHVTGSRNPATEK